MEIGNYIGTGRHLLSVQDQTSVDTYQQQHQLYNSAISTELANNAGYLLDYSGGSLIIDYGMRFLNETINNLAESAANLF